MQQALAEAVQEAADNAGIDCDLREDYSGRGMYGRSTYALVFNDMSDALAAMLWVNPNPLDLDWGGPLFSTDSMGRGIVIY